MVTFATEEATFIEACQTAENLITRMSTIPVDYVRAIGKPFVSLTPSNKAYSQSPIYLPIFLFVPIYSCNRRTLTNLYSFENWLVLAIY